MLIAKIAVTGVRATSTKLGTLTSGMVGARVQFTFDSSWDGLSKTAVFRCMDITKDVLNIDSEVTIPHEVLVRSGSPLYAGVYGSNADGTEVIPTVWATVGTVYSGADPSGDPSTERSPDVWEQLQAQINKLREQGVDDATIAAAVEKWLEENPVEVDIPKTLPNPHKLTFTGAVQAEYDGSEAVEVEIPAGGGIEVTGAEVGQTIVVKAVDENGKPIRWKGVDRTHWVEQGMVEVLAETTVALSDDGEANIEPFTLAGGDTYIVKWNGVEYECIAQDLSAMVGSEAYSLGNHKAMGMEDTGEPFIITSMPSHGTGMIGAFDGSATLTISIYQESEVVHHLDPKYIKDMYYTEGGLVEILPETTLTTTENNLGEFYIEENPPVLVAGNTYIVNWNGTEYTCTAQDLSALMAGAVGLGDMYTHTDGAFGTAATGEPYVLIYAPGIGFSAQAIKATEGLSLTLSIHQSGEIVHKIPNKYLDLDWLPTKTESEVAFLPETTIEFSNGQYLATTTNMLTLGDKYTVLLDGESYSFVAKQMDIDSGDTTFYLGNHGLTGGEDTGEPLLYATQITGDGELVAIMVVADAFTGSKTVAISHFNQTYNKLPEAYLPDSVESVIIRSSTAGSTKKFKLSVDDSGTITATEVT